MSRLPSPEGSSRDLGPRAAQKAYGAEAVLLLDARPGFLNFVDLELHPKLRRLMHDLKHQLVVVDERFRSLLTCQQIHDSQVLS